MITLFALGCLAVISFPDYLNEAMLTFTISNEFVIPFDGWSSIHALSTVGLLFIYPNITQKQYWLTVIGWEFVEQLLVPRLCPSYARLFLEDSGDTLGDLIVAIPASFFIRCPVVPSPPFLPSPVEVVLPAWVGAARTRSRSTG